MDVHKNARSVPASRALLWRRVSEQGWSLRAAAEAAGMSERRCREWLRRSKHREELTDRSSRPRSIAATCAETRAEIVALRRERRTMRHIARVVGVSVATVARICKAEGLSRLESLECPPPPIRYEADAPGELLHIDTKRLGRFDRPGHRVTRTRSQGSRKQGFEFVFVATDDHSRTSFARIFGDERGEAACQFLLAAVAWFAAKGVHILRILTDNGAPFRSRAFRALCAKLGIKHTFTRPYTPRTNGKVERMIQTLLREWAYRFTFESSAERKQWLVPYLHFYNFHRAHSSLGDQPPISRLDRNNLMKRNS